MEGCRTSRSHPTTIARRKSARAVRSALRKFQAKKRDDLYQQINEAQIHENKTFHMLIARQRNAPKQQSGLIRVEGKEVTDPEEQCIAWREHFATLADPRANTEFTSDLLDRAEEDLKLIDTCLNLTVPDTEVHTETVRKAIQSLNTGKALDNSNISAEHLKYAGDCVLPHVTNMVKEICKNKEVPQYMKEGRKIPIPKKGKDPTDRKNSRGITITSVLGKVLETSLLITTPIPSNQHPLQVGFTTDRSPGLGTLHVTEGLGEATFKKQHLYVVTLDAKTAFDVVSHPILIRKIFLDSIPKDMVAVIRDLYRNATENIVWKGHYSDQYPVQQGVRQGGVLSTHLYKTYIDGLLMKIKEKGIGLHIGTEHMGVSACADDVILLADTEEEIQQLVDMAYEYSQAHRYILHPQKSEILTLNRPPTNDVKLGPHPLPAAKHLVHLGVERNLQQPRSAMGECIENRIKLGRRTAYSLMSVGMYSGSGLNPTASLKILNTYVVPRVVYGLDAVLLNSKDTLALDTFHRNLLRDIQGLPRQTAKEAIYLLVGAIPLEAELHARSLTLAGTVSRLDHDNPLKVLAERQMASGNIHSWFTHVLKLAEQYNIPLEAYLLEPWGKVQWKKTVRGAIRSYWNFKLVSDASSKTSLKYISPKLIGDGTPHPVWKETNNNTRSIRAAVTRAKLLSGTYPLQTNLKRNHQNASDICNLCNRAAEDMSHFILLCPALEDVRSVYLSKLKDLFSEMNWEIPPDKYSWSRIILNGDQNSVTCRSPRSKLHSNVVSSRCSCRASFRKSRVGSHVEVVCRFCTIGQRRLATFANDLCLKLHSRRSEILATLVQGGPE